MPKTYPFCKQLDAMDCGPACLKMIAESYGKTYSLPFLREQSYLSRDGVSAEGISEAAEQIGLKTMAVLVPYETADGESCLLSAPLPVVAHWKQNHFVVLYEVEDRYVRLADPAHGVFKIPRADFEANWTSDAGKGIVVMMEATPDFYNKDQPEAPSAKSFGRLFQYLRPHRGLIAQIFLGMAVGTLLSLILPFLTKSVVDVGIANESIIFIYLMLSGQFVILLSQTFISFIQNRILLTVGMRINISLAADFLIKLMRLPARYFDAKTMGDLLRRLSDQDRIEAFLTQSSISFLFSLLNFVAFSVLLFFSTLLSY